MILSGLFTVIIVVITMFNVISNSHSQEENVSLLSLENLEALAYDLPEVSVVCGISSGKCWLEDKKLAGPLLPWYVTYCPRRTDNTNIYCVPGMVA